MKRLIFLLFITISFFNLKAQSFQDDFQEFTSIITTCVVDETNGYLLDTKITTGGAIVNIKTPDSYTNDKLISTLNKLFKGLKFETVLPWGQAQDDKGSIMCAQSSNGMIIMFNYEEKKHNLCIMIPLE